MVTPEQYAYLVQGVDPRRVRQLKGQSHMEAWDIRRTLIRTFGFGGFDIETRSLDLIAEIQHTHDKDGNPIPAYKPRWTVVYRAQVRLTIKAPDGTVLAVFEDVASGDSQNQPSLGDAHDQAMKTACSQGLKRCAVNLGDQFGLSLYNGGKTEPVVHRTLNAPEGPPIVAAELPVTEVLAEQAPPAPDTEHSTTPATAAPTTTGGPTVAALLEKIAACTTRDHLAAVWKEIMAAGRDGAVSTPDVSALKAEWKDRDRKINAVARMFVVLGQAEIKARDERLAWYIQIIGRTVDSTNDLTLEEIGKVTERTEAWIAQNEPAAAGAK